MQRVPRAGLMGETVQRGAETVPCRGPVVNLCKILRAQKVVAQGELLGEVDQAYQVGLWTVSLWPYSRARARTVAMRVAAMVGVLDMYCPAATSAAYRLSCPLNTRPRRVTKARTRRPWRIMQNHRRAVGSEGGARGARTDFSVGT